MKAALFLVGVTAKIVQNKPADLFPVVTGDKECYIEGKSGMYVGMKDSTNSGRKCQKWGDDFPHKEARDVTGENLGNHSFCRDPDSTGEPWCFSMDPNKGKETCGVAKCTQDGPWARNFKEEADKVKLEIGSTDCECADQLYGSTTTTKDTSVAGTFLQKPCKCDK